jgi:hypothetical protein
MAVPWKCGEIVCPHCGGLTEGNATSVFLSHPLSAAQEAEFLRQAVDESEVANARSSPGAQGGQEPGSDN